MFQTEKTMREEYRLVDGKRLRCGYTTGSCAAAAAKVAAAMLLSGESGTDFVEIDTPSGKTLKLPVDNSSRDGGTASCAVRKDGGDDYDVTSGSLVYAGVRKMPEQGFVIEGGEGIGTVTLPGLDQPVGAAAINSVPRRMILDALREACEVSGFSGGLLVNISIPDGEKLAERTFNKRLGIVGGLSVLGTTGIVEPMSEAAFRDSIKAELSMLRACGYDSITLTPGNIGLDFLERNYPGLRPVKCANFIGESIILSAEAGFRNVLIAGHIGKLVKLVTGGFNTHSKYGDARLFVFAALAGSCGANRLLTSELLRCATSEAAIDLLKSAGLWEAVFCRILDETRRRLDEFCKRRSYDRLRCDVLFFSSKHGFLGPPAALPASGSTHQWV
ncbi:MAG: cobalt-precorrin-5B (C(1))-methyltransferase CbiD [Spirochaetaceae bacterium]|jgi:cobalt-precorrin-5B (C1)-methyltransferase|nr:cobalt-precorrin-5B (C(1))-methyltransferase CbiD [Spirochaetaceae bacterium]